METTKMIKEIPIEKVIVKDTLYPRKEFDKATVEKYRDSIEQLPPIIVNQDFLLVDGYHRLIAHRTEQHKTIQAEIIQLNEADILWESTRLNATHGLQLSQPDKKKLGRDFYAQRRSLSDICSILSVNIKTAQNWTKDIRDKEEDEQKLKMWDLWLNSETQEEVSDKLNIERTTIGRWLKTVQNGKLAEMHTPKPEIYNIWNFQSCNDKYGMNYPGRIPGQIVENLLYYYTQPFDIIVDPFGGGGTTIDVAKTMMRRYQVYDIAPVRQDIKQHDITTGFPDKAKGCDFIFLDPPYFDQKKGEYSDHATNLANMELTGFYDAMEKIFQSAAKTLKKGGYLAFIISSSKAEGQFTFHGFELAKRAEKYLQMVEWIDVPYSTQVHGGAFVKMAQEKKKILYLRRDLVIFQNGV
jgi:hypothetical protein